MTRVVEVLVRAHAWGEPSFSPVSRARRNHFVHLRREDRHVIAPRPDVVSFRRLVHRFKLRGRREQVQVSMFDFLVGPGKVFASLGRSPFFLFPLVHFGEFVIESHGSLVGQREPFVLLPERLRLKFLRVRQLLLHAVVGNKLALTLLSHARERKAVHSQPPHEVNHVERTGHVPVN